MHRAESFGRPLDYLAVFFFAGMVLLAETLLFHATKFILDYIPAMTVIGCAVAGIGLGAFLASRSSAAGHDLFAWCCGGTTASLYLAAYVLLRHPYLPALLAAVALVFVGPSLYIAAAFARGSARGVYLFDMIGAGTGVALTVFAFRVCGTEEIFLGITTLLPLAGAVWSATTCRRGTWWRLGSSLWLVLLGGIGATLLYHQLTSHALNIVRLVNPDAPNIPAQSILRRPSRLHVEKTYDSLEGRLDTVPTKDRVFVTYDGFFNDNFVPSEALDYREYAQPHDVRFPAGDRRVVYGLVPEPRVFIIGPAADGIIKTLRMITPADHIEAVEINPGVLQMMQHDYYEASGRAYEGLHPVLGNALSVLKRTDKNYDIITLINAHSARWIGALGPPDYLHTRESYDLCLDHLTRQGYLLFEERPDTFRGELGIKRMILTLWDCLKRRGMEDPSQHFFIWEFMSNRHHNQGGRGIVPGSDMYYVGMIVSLEPLTGKRRQDLLDWYHMEWFVRWDERKQPIYYPSVRLLEGAYLKAKWHGARFGPFFDMIAAHDFSKLDADFDASIITNDRPFASYATRSIPELQRLVAITSGICLLLIGLFTAGAWKGLPQTSRMNLLVLYNVAIGFAYFFVEIVLIQACQNVFLSPSLSLVLVLGVLLIGSAIGGLFTGRIPPWVCTALLAPVLLLCLHVPDWTVAWGLGPVISASLAVTAIFLVGMNMGVYFPTGLQLAWQSSLRTRIPHLFAINAAAGSMASIISLYLGIRLGYTWTLAIAVLLYAVASFVHQRVARSGPTPLRSTVTTPVTRHGEAGTLDVGAN